MERKNDDCDCLYRGMEEFRRPFCEYHEKMIINITEEEKKLCQELREQPQPIE